MQDGVPVDQALAAVNQVLVVERDEYLGDGPRQALVHRETVAAPVDGTAEPPQLIGNLPAGLLLPLPDALDELLAAEFAPRRAFRVQEPLDDHLRGDAGVVHARLPQCLVATHSLVTRQRVHDRVLERVPHVQGARHVGRRDHDAIRFAVAARREISRLLPAGVDAFFYVVRLVGLVHSLSAPGRGFRRCAFRVRDPRHGRRRSAAGFPVCCLRRRLQVPQCAEKHARRRESWHPG